MNPDNGFLGFTLFGAVLIPTMITIVAMLLLYGIIRVAVARGLRDHQLWLEKHRPEFFDRHYQAITPPQ